MDISVASELLIAVTSLAGHLESMEDPKSAGCGTGFGFFQERDRALVPGWNEGGLLRSTGLKWEGDGMLKHEEGLSNPQGSARNRRHPTEPDGGGGGKSPQQVV